MDMASSTPVPVLALVAMPLFLLKQVLLLLVEIMNLLRVWSSEVGYPGAPSGVLQRLGWEAYEYIKPYIMPNGQRKHRY